MKVAAAESTSSLGQLGLLALDHLAYSQKTRPKTGDHYVSNRSMGGHA